MMVIETTQIYVQIYKVAVYMRFVEMVLFKQVLNLAMMAIKMIWIYVQINVSKPDVAMGLYKAMRIVMISMVTI